MSDLTIQELKDKIAMVDKDLLSLRSDPGNERKLSVLSEYRDYLTDELKMLENENRPRTSTR
jgi:hypothetical protein